MHWPATALFVSLLMQTSSPPPAVQPKPEVFEVATVKPVALDAKPGRYITLQGPHRFVAKNFTLKLLIAAAYDLNPRTISGGPAWVESEHFDVEAITPGEARPTRQDQMTMLRSLLTERFQLRFHRQEKEFSLYALNIAHGGSKLRPSTAPNEQASLISTVYPQKIVMPARSATIDDFVAILQRAVLDRPVVNETGLQGKYDFELEWAPDETQFGGEVPVAGGEATNPPLLIAMQEQLGLRLDAKRGLVSALVVDTASKPVEN